jgi:NhaP-type Na+/H+ and K+/H+ antiporter
MRDSLSKFERRKRMCGIAFGFIYMVAAIFTILVVGLSIDPNTADAIFYTFIIQMSHDFFVNQPFKVLINLILLRFLSRYACSGCRKFILKAIDVNVATAFV